MQACHTETSWEPSTFDHDGMYFPIYTGTHVGEWDLCMDCHTIPGDLTMFSCTGCHTNPETDEEHLGVGGYSYSSEACLACHPTGEGSEGFDHNATNFPLTGAHLETDCIACHASGYAGTTTVCEDCHIDDYNSSTNPDHTALGIPTDCATCHTTDPDWTPASFDIHDDYYVLDGAHAAVAFDCAGCHSGDYNNTPNTCEGCHLPDYNSSTNPDHTALGIPTDCATCHTTDPDWTPASFDIHDDYYVLDGAHAAVAFDCAGCHSGDYNNTPNTCEGCQLPDYNSSTNPDHTALGIPTDCATCHTTDPDWTPASFDIHDDYYVLDGAHAAVAFDCAGCHSGDYNNTPNTCEGCHIADYNSTTNPDHTALGIPTDCATCHTTDPEWNPASFDIHDTYYVLNGAHAAIGSDCAVCHNGDYNNTPNTCFGCHTDEYNNTTDPDHTAAQFGTDCAACHTETSWEPSTFDHDGMYFPIYTGTHVGEWDLCMDCHTIPGDLTMFSCTGCHTNPETDEEHLGVGGYSYSSEACLACHPTGEGSEGFDHNATNFPLTGAHLETDCIACHASGYAGTTTVCEDCHIDDYNSTTNPDHTALGIPTDCATCHTTDPDWTPASFDIHDDYYVLDGAHAAVAFDCAGCHNGDYNNTPNTCEGCHIADYNSTTNPDHTALGIPTDCATCHTTDPEWNPASFDIHDTYYVLNGAHAAISSDCAACHNGDYNNTPNTCFGCHTDEYNNTTDPDHTAAQFPADCELCHTETSWEPSTFDHDGMYFPIYTGTHNEEWDQVQIATLLEGISACSVV